MMSNDLSVLDRSTTGGSRPRARSRVLVCVWLALCLLGVHPGPAAAQADGGRPWIRNVYIPADELKLLFDSSSKGVLMPRDKVLALWREGRTRTPSEAVPPADAVVTQALYEARLEEHALRMTGRIEIAKLRGDWQTVDLPFGGLAIESARWGDRPARFGRRDDGTLFLLLREEGRGALELEMSVPLASKGGDLAATLKLPPVPASEMRIRLDRGKQLRVGEKTLPPDGSEDGQQVFRVAVDPTGRVPLVVSDRFAGGNRAPLVFVDSRSIGQVKPAGLRWQVALDLEVCARRTDSFELQLPDSVEVAEVEVPQLAQWTIREPADGAAVVALTFRRPFLGRRTVRLLGLAPAPIGEPWEFPKVKVLEAAAHVGEVWIDSSPSLRVEVGTLAGIRPERLGGPGEATSEDGAPASDAPGNDGASGVSRRNTSVPAPVETKDTRLTFAFWDENFALPLRVIPRRRRVQASVATLVEVDRAGLALRSSVTVEPRDAPLFAVRMQLPRDWEIASVLAADRPAKWESVEPAGAEPGAEPPLQTVQFDLAEPVLPGGSLEITLTAQRHPEGWLEQEESFSELPFPEVRLVGADEVEGTVLLRAPPELEVLVSDLSDDLQPVAADRSGGPSAPGPGTALQYRYQDDARTSGLLRVRPVPAKVSAETLAFVRLDRGKLDVHYDLDLHVQHGTLRQVRFTLPAAVGEKIQIVPVGSPARVIEKRHTPVPESGEDGAGSYLWQIVLDRPITGDLTLAVDFGQTFSVPGSGGEGAPAKPGPPVAVPVLALANVSRQSGTVAVEAAGDQEIAYEPQSLRELDPADVAEPRAYVPTQRIVAAYQYPRLPYRLTISATRHAAESVLAGICESAEVVSVAGRQGRMRHQARFWVRSPNLQQLSVTLPPEADLWSVLLGGEPVEVRRKRGTYIVPLPPREADSAGGSREIALLYETRSSLPRAEGLWGRLRPRTIRQRAPEIDMTTLASTWRVHPPEGTDVVSAGGDYDPETRLARPTLAGRLAEAIARQSTSALGWKFGGLVAAVVGAFLILAMRTGKGRSFTVVELLVVIAIIGMLIALLLPATQAARETARRAQCSNNVKQIGLALHNYHDVHGQFPPAAIGPHDVPRRRQFSWMVAILPYLEQNALYEALRLDLPWDHPHNAAVLQIAPTTLFCPSDATSSTTQEGWPKTSYVAITGADVTHGPGDVRGIIGFDRGLSCAEIVDGTSNTLLVGEVIDGGPWFAGGSGTARRIDDWIENKTWSYHPGGGNFAMADGSVRFLSSNTDVRTLRHLATAQGMEEIVDEDFDAYGTPPSGAEATVPSPGAVPEAEPAPPEEEASEAEAEEAAAEAGPGAGPPAAGKAKPPPQAPRRPVGGRGDRARLSLRVALETHGAPAVRLRREGGPGELVLGVQDRASAHMLQRLLVAGALLGAWVGRRAPWPRRAMAVVVGLALPLGLSGLVPLAWTPLLDGLLLGALAAGCLWLLPKAIAALGKPIPLPRATAALVGVVLLAAAGANAAEEDPFAVGKKPEAVKPEAQSAQARQPDLTLFIPYDPDDDRPLEKTQVYLPHDEFLRLWKEAHPEEPDDVPPDVRAMVSHAEYSGTLEGDVARFDGRLLIHHLDDRWVRVALPLGDVALEKVEVDGRPATLADPRAADKPTEEQAEKPPSTKQGAQPGKEALSADVRQPAVYLEEAGMHVVDLRFSVPVSRLGATGRTTVPLGEVPSGLLELRLPAEELDVQVGGCPGGWRRRAGGEAEGDLVSIPLGDTGELSIRWQPRRVEARTGRLVSVDQALLVEVLDSGVHLHGRVHYRVQRGSLDEVQLRIPTGVAVQRVDGDRVADWSIETEAPPDSEPEVRRLVVAFKSELTGGTDVDVHGFCGGRKAVGTIDVDGLEPLGVVRETGRIAIGGSKRLRVRVGQAGRLDQINRAGLNLPHPPSDGSDLVAAYRYTSRPWRLELEVERVQPRLEVSGRTAVAVTARRATLRSLLSARVSGAPIPALAVRVPASLRVSQVRVPPGAEWFLDSDGEGRRVTVRLKEPTVGELDLAVSGSLARGSSRAEFVVPGVRVEAAEAQRGQLAIYVDDDLEAVLAGDGGARPIAPAELDDVLRPEGGGPVRYAFRYESPPEGLRLRLARATSRASGDVTTVVSVREGAVAYLSQVDFEVRQAGRSRFRVATPKWLGDDVELQGERVRQIRSQETDTERIWEIELQQPVRGDYRLHLTQTLPLADDGTVPAAVIRPLDVERSRSHVVLENLTADEIAATNVDGATSISIAALPEGLADEVRRQAVAAYRIADDSASLMWQRRVREQETGLRASINLADLTTVVHADGRYRARAAYNVRNSTLQFLELELPADARVWSVHVSGEPVRPARIRRRGRPITLLPLEKTSAGDFSSKVVVVYSGDLGPPLGAWRRIRPPAPQLVSDVPVSRTLWTLFLPREYRVGLVESESNVEAVAAAYQQQERKLSFLDELRQMMQVAATRGKSGARTKARFNLKQIGSALEDYAEQSARVDEANAAAVQQQAQHLESEIERLEELKTETGRAEADAGFYFHEAEEDRPEVDSGAGFFEQLSELRVVTEDEAERDDAAKEQRDDARRQFEEQRGRLREQAAKQLQSLETAQQAERLEQEEAAPQKPAEPAEPPREWESLDSARGAEQRITAEAPATRAAPGAEGAAAGYLSFDLDLAPAGTAHHFRKLHGKPELVVRVRHENVARFASAVLWAGVCLGLAAAAIYGLRRPEAAAVAQRAWPWLAAIAGTAWLFLLPAGFLGWVLLVTALCVAIARAQKRNAPGSPESGKR